MGTEKYGAKSAYRKMGGVVVANTEGGGYKYEYKGVPDEEFYRIIREQNYDEVAKGFRNAIITQLGIIGTAVGVTYWGPPIAAGGSKALTWTALKGGGVASTIYRYGEQYYYRGLTKFMQHKILFSQTFDYFTGLLTPPYMPPTTRGGAAAVLTTQTKFYQRLTK